MVICLIRTTDLKQTLCYWHFYFCCEKNIWKNITDVCLLFQKTIWNFRCCNSNRQTAGSTWSRLCLEFKEWLYYPYKGNDSKGTHFCLNQVQMLLFCIENNHYTQIACFSNFWSFYISFPQITEFLYFFSVQLEFLWQLAHSALPCGSDNSGLQGDCQSHKQQKCVSTELIWYLKHCPKYEFDVAVELWCLYILIWVSGGVALITPFKYPPPPQEIQKQRDSTGHVIVWLSGQLQSFSQRTLPFS